MTIAAQTYREFSSSNFPVHGFKGRFALSRVVNLLALWQERWLQRRHLAQLTAWELQDIGRSRQEAFEEANKPFWQA